MKPWTALPRTAAPTEDSTIVGTGGFCIIAPASTTTGGPTHMKDRGQL
ncbi:hypothetical protein K4749_24010 [Streptomyces sp. TRM72054]|nr:hypothetical protein [Streptomyces sp. TRM72054]MBX9396565.1 hypothetical protein [Streptomyces sp. TRM72054]